MKECPLRPLSLSAAATRDAARFSVTVSGLFRVAEFPLRRVRITEVPPRVSRSEACSCVELISFIMYCTPYLMESEIRRFTRSWSARGREKS